MLLERWFRFWGELLGEKTSIRNSMAPRDSSPHLVLVGLDQLRQLSAEIHVHAEVQVPLQCTAK